MEGGRAELFDEALISELTGGRRHYPRVSLVSDVMSKLDDPGCRVMLVTGAPGAGKSALMAHLAEEQPDWPRYFIRRTAESTARAFRHEGGLASFLTLVGFQLMTLHPEAFPEEDTQLRATVKADVIGPGANVSAVRVREWFAHPFRRGALFADLQAALVEGEAAAVEVGRLIVDVAAIEPAALADPALRAPVRKLGASGHRVVILLDGLDELRFRDTASDVGHWLAGFTEFPENLRIIVAARPETSLLRELELHYQGSVRHVRIEPGSEGGRQDGEGYLRRLSAEKGIAAVLGSHGVSGERFVREVLRKVSGNFLYLNLIARLLDGEAERARPNSPAGTRPAPDLDWLRSLEALPAELRGFYALLLVRLRNRIGGKPATRQDWARLYRALLGMLAVTTLPLTGRQFKDLGEIGYDQASVDGALDQLRFFLDAEADGVRLSHASMADFLTAEATARSDPELYCDAVAWHGRIADHAIRSHQLAGNWPNADPYLRARLPFHAAESGRLDDLVEDPSYLLAADPDALVPELGAVDRAATAARVYQQVVPLVRAKDVAAARLHLRLYAEQAGLAGFAARVSLDPAASPWLIDFTRWQDVQLRQVLGQHGAEVRAAAVARGADGGPLALTAGWDGRIRIWDVTSGQSLEPLPASTDDVERPRPLMALAAGELDNGEAIAVCGDIDGAVRVWNLVTRQPAGAPMIGAENAGWAVAAAYLRGVPHAVCRIGGELRAWDMAARAPAPLPFATAEGLREAKLAAGERDGRLVVAASVHGDGEGGAVQVWDAASRTACGPVIATADDGITAVAVAELGGTLLVAVADVLHGIQVFDALTGRPVTHRALDIGLPLVTALAMGTIDGRPVVAAGDESGEVRFRELPALRRFGDPVRVHDLAVTALAFGAGEAGGLLMTAGRDAAAEGGAVPAARFWALGKHGRGLRAAAAPARLPDSAYSVALARLSGRLEAVAADGRVAMCWDVLAGTAAGAPLGGRNDRVCAVGVSTVAGRTTVVSATYDKAVIRTWDVPSCLPARHPVTGEPLVRRDIETVRGLAVTRLGDRGVAVCAGWSDIHVWDVATGEPAGAGLITGPRNVLGLAVGELGGRPVVACATGSSTTSGGVMVFDLETGAPVDPPYPGGHGSAEAVAIASGAHQTLIVSSDSILSVRVWNPASGDRPAEIRVGGETTVLAATQVRGHPVAVCSGRKGEVRLVDLLADAPAARSSAGPVNALAVADVGGRQVVLCAARDGVRVLDLRTGQEALPSPRAVAGHRVSDVATGVLNGRPVAVACGYASHVWYLDSGEPLSPQPPWPRDVRSVAIADMGNRVVAVIPGEDRGAIVADLATGELFDEVVFGLPDSRLDGVALTEVSGHPVLLVRGNLGIKARFLYLPWLPEPPAPGLPAVLGEETPPPPPLFPAKQLIAYPHGGGWCMAAGSFQGQPVVISGHAGGDIDLFAVASGLPLRPALGAGTADVSALAFSQLGSRPVIAVGGIDGAVRVADLTTLVILGVIRTLAPVQAVALAAPDHCLIGTEKGLIGARITGIGQPGRVQEAPARLRLPVDVRAARTCPRHDVHVRHTGHGGDAVAEICIKGVQLRSGVRKPDSLSYPAGHCRVTSRRLEITADGSEWDQPLVIDLAGVFAEPRNDPEAYLADGCHFGVALDGDSAYKVLSCYRRSERDWLVEQVNRRHRALT